MISLFVQHRGVKGATSSSFVQLRWKSSSKGRWRIRRDMGCPAMHQWRETVDMGAIKIQIVKVWHSQCQSINYNNRQVGSTVQFRVKWTKSCCSPCWYSTASQWRFHNNKLTPYNGPTLGIPAAKPWTPTRHAQQSSGRIISWVSDCECERCKLHPLFLSSPKQSTPLWSHTKKLNMSNRILHFEMWSLGNLGSGNACVHDSCNVIQLLQKNQY